MSSATPTPPTPIYLDPQFQVLVLAGLGAGLQILSKYVLKNPSALPDLTPIIQSLIATLSHTAGEDAQETGQRMAYHDALVRKYGAGPPPA